MAPGLDYDPWGWVLQDLCSYLGNDPVNRIDPAGYGKPGMLSRAWKWTRQNAGDVADRAVEKGKQIFWTFSTWHSR